MSKRIAIVTNPLPENSKAKYVAETIAATLDFQSVSHVIFNSDWPDDFTGFTEAWIVGGDGTLNYFINKYPDIKIPLSTFLGGSGNDFHWLLYKDIDVEEQVIKLLKGDIVEIDAGVCNGKLFLNGVGIGFDGAIVNTLLGKKKVGGKSSYLLAILKNLVAYSEKPCTIETDDKVISQDCFLISVANGKRYGGGFCVAPKASPTDGLLDVNIVGEIHAIKRLKYLPVIEKGEHLDLHFVQYLHSKKVTIKSPVHLHAHLDGEYLFSNSFEIECLPKKFSFVV